MSMTQCLNLMWSLTIVAIILIINVQNNRMRIHYHLYCRPMGLLSYCKFNCNHVTHTDTKFNEASKSTWNMELKKNTFYSSKCCICDHSIVHVAVIIGSGAIMHGIRLFSFAWSLGTRLSLLITKYDKYLDYNSRMSSLRLGLCFWLAQHMGNETISHVYTRHLLVGGLSKEHPGFNLPI